MSSAFLYANEKPSNEKWLKVDLMAFLSSQQVFRGAVFYPYASMGIGPGFTFFKQFALRGPNLAWFKGTRESSSQYELGMRLISDGDPMLKFSSKFDEDTDFRAARSDSFEFYYKYNYRFGFKNLFEIGAFFTKEVHRHKGVYTGLHFKVPVYKYTSLTFKTGVGSSFHNKYIYGPEAKSGLADQAITLRYVLPKLPWQGVIIFEAAGSWVIQSENRAADFIRNEGNQLIASTRWVWSIY